MFETIEPRRLLNLAPFGVDPHFPSGKMSFQRDPAVAVAANGQFIVASSPDIGNTTGITAVRYAANGERIGNILTLADVSASMDADGDAVVVFSQLEGDFTTNIYFVRISRSNVVSAPVLLATETAEDADSLAAVDQPAVSMDEGGGSFTGWLRYEAGGFADLEFRAFDSSGSPRSNVITIDTNPSFIDFARDLTISSMPDGSSAVFAYWVSFSDSSEDDVRFGRINTSGLVGQQQATAAGQSVSPSVAVKSDGSFFLAYEQHPFGQDVPENQIRSFVQAYNPAGSAQGEPTPLAASLGGTAVLSPSIDQMPDGGFVATYTKINNNLKTLFAQRFSATGTPDEAGPVDLYAEPAPGAFKDALVQQPVIGSDDLGNAVVAYTTRDDDSNQSFSPRFRRLTTSIAAIDDKVLWVLGTRRSDAMSVKQRGGSLFAALGNDSLKFAASRVLRVAFEGFNGHDRIFSETVLPATVRGGSGDDFILSDAGTDVLRGNTGNDTIFAGAGQDRLLGDDGDDSLYGQDHADTLDGGNGDDRLYGNSGNDSLLGGAGHDQLRGGAHRDTLRGDAGQDRLFGEDGNDQLHGGDDSDRLEGGAGDDRLFSRDGFIDGLFGGDGLDSADNDAIDLLDGVETST